MSKRKRSQSDPQEDPDHHVTRRGERKLVYHRGMHRGTEGMLCHYLGLTNKSALRRLRLSQPVLYAWAHFLKPMLHRKYLDTRIIFKMFDLFIEYDNAKAFEDHLGDTFTWDTYRAKFWPLDEAAKEATKVDNFAFLLVTLKHSLAQALVSNVDVDELEDVSEEARKIFKECNVNDWTLKFDPRAFKVPVIPYTAHEKIKLLQRKINEHEFEQYQRLFILLRHTDTVLTASKWAVCVFDLETDQFREANWARDSNGQNERLRIKAEDMPLWMDTSKQSWEDGLAARGSRKKYQMVQLLDTQGARHRYADVDRQLKYLDRTITEVQELKIDVLDQASGRYVHDAMSESLGLRELSLRMADIYILDKEFTGIPNLSADQLDRTLQVWAQLGIPDAWWAVQEFIVDSRSETISILYVLEFDQNINPDDDDSYPWETDSKGKSRSPEIKYAKDHDSLHVAEA